VAEDLRMALLELFPKAALDEDVDFLREGVRAMAQQFDGAGSGTAHRSRQVRAQQQSHW
jgi:hypothetical protein